jgi:hypothetical protein
MNAGPLEFIIVVGLCACLGGWLYRSGRRAGVRQCLADCRRAFEHGRLIGRREERIDWIGRKDSEL